jgi:hypothetical protein
LQNNQLTSFWNGQAGGNDGPAPKIILSGQIVRNPGSELFGNIFVIKAADVMESKFTHIEKDLAIEAWFMYGFKIYDMLLQEDFESDGWLKPVIAWYQQN